MPLPAFARQISQPTFTLQTLAGNDKKLIPRKAFPWLLRYRIFLQIFGWETLSVSQNIQNKCGVAAVLNENIWTQKDYQSDSKLTPSLFLLRMVPFNIGAALLFRYSSESKSSGITAKKWEAVDSENFVDCEISLKAPVIVGYERSAEAP